MDKNIRLNELMKRRKEILNDTGYNDDGIAEAKRQLEANRIDKEWADEKYLKMKKHIHELEEIDDEIRRLNGEDQTSRVEIV